MIGMPVLRHASEKATAGLEKTPSIHLGKERGMTNRTYMIYGDLTSDKSSENYPEKVLCEECVAGYEVVAESGPSDEPCEDCGGPKEE